MRYYKLKEVLLLNGSGHDETLERAYRGYTFADFEAWNNRVYWHGILRLLDFTDGHKTKRLEAFEQSIAPAKLTILSEAVHVTTEDRRYVFTLTCDPLEQLLKE